MFDNDYVPFGIVWIKSVCSWAWQISSNYIGKAVFVVTVKLCSYVFLSFLPHMSDNLSILVITGSSFLGPIWWGKKEWNLKPEVSSSITCCLVRVFRDGTWNLEVSSSPLNPWNLNPLNFEGDQIWSLGFYIFNLKKICYVVFFWNFFPELFF